MVSLRFTVKKGDIFKGEIQDLSNYDSEGWRRRDICFFKTTAKLNYPSPKDSITLIDTSGNRYNLWFSNPEDDHKICLGTPENLESWYQRKGFSDSDVKKIRKDGYRDRIYFEYTGSNFDFSIFTEDEYIERGSADLTHI